MKFTDDMRSKVQAWGAGVAATLTLRWWGLFLAAFVLAAGCAELVYVKLNLPQRYSELVVGAIAWTYENKFHDYAVLYAFVASFMVVLALAGTLAARLKRDFGVDGVDRLHSFVLLLCAPAGLWLGGLFTTKLDVLWTLRLSEALLTAALLFGFALSGKGAAFWSQRADSLFRVTHTWMLFVVLAALAVSAVGVAVNRLGARIHTHYWMASADVWLWTCIAGAAGVVLGVLVTLRTPDAAMLEGRAKRMLLVAQLFLPLLLLCVVPPAWTWTPDGTLASGYRLSAFAKVFVVGCVIAAYVELYARFKAVSNADPYAGPLKFVSVGCAVGVLLFLKTAPVVLAAVSPDDYHFGEMLVPWWSWFEKGLLPFWDYAPARGLINYIPGLLSSLLFDGRPASIAATYPFVFVVMAAIALPVLRTTLGIGGGFVAVLLGPAANGYGEIDLATAVFLACFCAGYFRWAPERWLLTFAVFGVALVLYAPGQGALTLVACSPLALSVMWKLFSRRPRRLLYVLLIIFAALASVFLLTPVGRMVFGALRYGAEQAGINSIAHGVNWSASFGEVIANPWLFELMRVSWLLVATWSLVLIFRALMTEANPDRTRILVYATPIFIVLVLFMVRAVGRIDGGGSRLALASDWALALLFPLLLFVAVRVRGVHILLWVTLAGSVVPHAGGLTISRYAQNFDPVKAAGFNAPTTSRSNDSTRFGLALVDKDHLARVAATRRVLDVVLDPDETYLDLTTRHAVYYYVDRRPPVESGAMYNLVGEQQQLRASRSIRAAKLPAILLSADNLTHDGGPSSLRSNLVYREVLLSEGYKLASVGKQVWMVRDDRLARLSALPEVSIQAMDDAPNSLLVDIFRHYNLKAVPASWGRSVRALKKELEPVLDVPASMLIAVNDANRVGNAQFVVTGRDPFIRFDISAARLAGKSAGLLSFDFSCDRVPAKKPTLAVYWSTTRSPENPVSSFILDGLPGHMIVPIDSSPAWLLAKQINSIRIDIENSSNNCEKFSISNVRLMRRAAAHAAP